MAKELRTSIEELLAWVEENREQRGVIILAAENLKTEENGQTECDASIAVAGKGDLLCHLYEKGITTTEDDNPLRSIHKRVMRKLNLCKTVNVLADVATAEGFSDEDKETPASDASKGDNAAEQGKE